MKNPPSSLSRRRFLGQASCAAIGSTALFNTLLNLRMAGTAAGQSIGGGNDYRALVCLFLSGGNDSFNMLVPRGNAEYAEYAAIRHNWPGPGSGGGRWGGGRTWQAPISGCKTPVRW